MAGININTAHALRAMDANGSSVSGALLKAYTAGTATAITTYSDEEMTTANAWPVVATSAGAFGSVYVPAGSYKFDVQTSAGVSLPGFPIDDVHVAGVRSQDIDTRTAVLTTTVVSTVNFIRTAGYSTVGDGGGGLYKRAASAPSHAGKVQSADGAWWELVKDGRNNNLQFGASGGSDKTTEFQNFLNFIEDGVGFILKATDYQTDTLTLKADTTLVIEPGTVINKITGGARILQISAANVHVWGYGAEIKSADTGGSHTLYFEQGAADCSVRGLLVTGSGTTGDDCIYVGGDPANNNVPTDIYLADVSTVGTASTRNGISLVAVDGFRADRCNFSNGGGSASPGCGADVEANRYMANGTSAVKNIIFDQCDFHDNDNSGFGVQFGSDVTCINCRSYNNNDKGFFVSTGGAQFDADVYRTGDRLAVSAVNTGTGELTVSSGAAGTLLTTDLGIVPGMVVVKLTNNSASWPTEIDAFTYLVIASVDSTQTKITLAESWLYNEKTSLSGGSYATLTTDPTTSDLHLRVAGREGNATGCKFIDCEAFDNAQGGAAHADFYTEHSTGTEFIRCKSRSANVVNANGIKFSLSHRTKIIDCDVAPATFGTNADGIVAGGAVSKFTIKDTRVHGYGAAGIVAIGLTDSVIENVDIHNCGMTSSPALELETGNGGVTRDVAVRNDTAHRASIGMHIESTVTGHRAENVRCTGNASDDPFLDQGTSSVISGVYENGVRQTELATATATNIADAAAAINTTGKYTGKMVKDTTNNRLMVSRGSDTTSIWDVADGSASVTPA